MNNVVSKGVLPFLCLLMPLAACTTETRPQVAEENPAFSDCARDAYSAYPDAAQADARAQQLNACLMTAATRAPRVAAIHSF